MIKYNGQDLADIKYNGSSIKRVMKDGVQIWPSDIPPISLKPIMTNFRVNEATPTHIHFDAPLGPVTGLTDQGFVVSGKNIISINTTLGYIEVDTPFTFWSNNTIRLGENTDTSHSQSVVYNFTMRYIENNIVEPSAAVERFVSDNGSGDGTSEGNAASMSYMMSNAAAGQTWWMKAGTYPITSNNTLNKLGNPTSPIKIIGYKTDPGDITSLSWNYGDGVTSSEMPWITSSSSGISGFRNEQSNVIIRNIGSSITGSGSVGFYLSDGINTIIDGCVSYNTPEYGILGWNEARLNCRYTNCKVQGARFNIWLWGDRSLIDNCESYSGTTTTYLLQAEGNNNIIKDSKLLRAVDNPNHTGHGINFNLVNGTETAYNLAVDCEVMNCDKGLEFRKNNSHDNVCRGLNVYTDGTTGTEDSGGIYFRDGADNNIAENCIVDTSKSSNTAAIRLTDSDEQGNTGVGNDNMVRNSIFKNCSTLIITESIHTSTTVQRFKFYNNTVDNVTRFIWNQLEYVTPVDCEFKNNMFSNITTQYYGVASATGWAYDSNNFYNNGWSAVGTNITEVNPNFDANYKPQAAFDDIDAAKLTMVADDYDMNERFDPTTRGAIKSDGEASVPQPPGTVGNTNPNMTTTVNISGELRSSQFSMAENGTLQSVSIWHDGVGNTSDLILGVYSDNGDEPNALLGTTAEITTLVNGWNTIDLVTPVALNSGQKLWLAFSATNLDIRYDSGTGLRAIDSTVAYQNPLPNTFVSSSTLQFDYAIYANYI